MFTVVVYAFVFFCLVSASISKVIVDIFTGPIGEAVRVSGTGRVGDVRGKPYGIGIRIKLVIRITLESNAAGSGRVVSGQSAKVRDTSTASRIKLPEPEAPRCTWYPPVVYTTLYCRLFFADRTFAEISPQGDQTAVPAPRNNPGCGVESGDADLKGSRH